MHKPKLKPHLWLIATISLVVPRRFRSGWRQEWEAELHYHESTLRRWRKLNILGQSRLLRRSLGAFHDALCLQPARLEDEMLQDLKYGSRMLLRRPGFTLVALTALALGIGANTAIFSVVNAVLLRPLPFSDSERIVRIWNTFLPRGLTQLFISVPEFVEYRDQARTFDSIAAFLPDALNLTGAGEPERVPASWISQRFFSVLGVEPQLGRSFYPEEYQPGRDRVVIVSHRLWKGLLASDPALIGKTIMLNGNDRTVVGIMPSAFDVPSEDIDVWVPFTPESWKTGLGQHFLSVIARLQPGASLDNARTEMTSVVAGLAQKYPDYYKDAAGSGVDIVPLREQVVGNIRLPLLVLFGAVCFILLIACANVANLLLARAEARHKEIAIRMALGASRLRVVRQLLTESLLLALLGGCSGLLLAVWGVRLFTAQNPFNIPRMRAVSIDMPILGFALMASFLTGVVFGLAPALQSSKPGLNEPLKEGSRGAAQGAGYRGSRTRSLVVISELALSVVLLIGAGLMIRSFRHLLGVNLGFNTEGVLTAQLSLSKAKYPDNQRVTAFYHQLLQRISGVPGVQAAGAVNSPPLSGDSGTASFEIEGRTSERESDGLSPIAAYHLISPDYFQTMGITVLWGRHFTELDGNQSPAAAIINQTLAHRFWGNDYPTGKRIRLREDAPWLQIIGVVADVKNRAIEDDARPEMYFPYVETPFGIGPPSTMTLVVRTQSDPLQSVAAIRDEIRAMDKDLPMDRVRTMARIAAAAVSRTRFIMFLLASLAGLALILAAVGVYGVMSYSVSQRTHEIGIRKALGAQPQDIIRLVVGHVLSLVLIGIGAGVLASLALTRVMSSLLFEIRANDPVTFVGISLLLFAVALLACCLPVRRALKVFPMVALRYE